MAGVAAAAVSAALIAIPTVAQAGGGKSDQLAVVGLTDNNRLVTFTTDRPGWARNRGPVDGLSGDKSLVGIDFGVQNNRLYGVGDAGGIYTINAGKSLTVDGRAGLYEVDLLTGDADLVKRFAGNRQVVDIAVYTSQKKR